MFSEKLVTIANAVVEANKTNKARELVRAHYADDAVSVEALAMGEGGRETHGIDGILGKHDYWENAFETHNSSVAGPFLHGDDRFSVIFEVDVTERETGKRSQMKEIGAYTINDGKIVREEFFYMAD